MKGGGRSPYVNNSRDSRAAQLIPSTARSLLFTRSSSSLSVPRTNVLDGGGRGGGTDGDPRPCSRCRWARDLGQGVPAGGLGSGSVHLTTVPFSLPSGNI